PADERDDRDGEDQPPGGLPPGAAHRHRAGAEGARQGDPGQRARGRAPPLGGCAGRGREGRRMTPPAPAGGAAPAEAEEAPARQSLGLLAQAMLGLRSTGDPATACAIAGDCARSALGASGYRLLRLELRSGALRRVDATGEETRYLPEPDGPVE